MLIIEQLLYQNDKSSHQGCSSKKAFHKNFAFFTGIFFVEVSLSGWGWNKEILTQMFSCEPCKISNSTCFEEHLCMAAFENNKIFLRKATCHNDHYMINMGGQRSKTGSNWPLTVPYLKCRTQPMNGQKSTLYLHIYICIIPTRVILLSVKVSFWKMNGS